MIKRFVLASLLALQLTAIAHRVTAEVPLPECLPCPEDGIIPPAR